jgi:flagellar hook-associated protein FlgK
MIGNIFGTAQTGIQRASTGIRKNAVEIVTATTRTDSQAKNVDRSLVEIKQHQHQSAANVRVLKAADEMLGTLLDVQA